MTCVQYDQQTSSLDFGERGRELCFAECCVLRISRFAIIWNQCADWLGCSSQSAAVTGEEHGYRVFGGRHGGKICKRIANIFKSCFPVNKNRYILNVLDDFNRERLGIEVDFSPPAERVVRSLNQIIEWRGKPLAIRVPFVRAHGHRKAAL